MPEARALGLTAGDIYREIEEASRQYLPQYRAVVKKFGFTHAAPFRGELEYVYREGEEEQLIYGSPVLRPDPVREDVAVMSVSFRQPVDIRGIRAVRLDGVEYPLETGPLPKQSQPPMEQTDVPELSGVFLFNFAASDHRTIVFYRRNGSLDRRQVGSEPLAALCATDELVGEAGVLQYGMNLLVREMLQHRHSVAKIPEANRHFGVQKSVFNASRLGLLVDACAGRVVQRLAVRRELVGH